MEPSSGSTLCWVPLCRRSCTAPPGSLAVGSGHAHSLAPQRSPGTVEESQAFHPHCTHSYPGLPRFPSIRSETQRQLLFQYQEFRDRVNTLPTHPLMSLKSKFNIQKHYQIMFAFFCSHTLQIPSTSREIIPFFFLKCHLEVPQCRMPRLHSLTKQVNSKLPAPTG